MFACFSKIFVYFSNMFVFFSNIVAFCAMRSYIFVYIRKMLVLFKNLFIFFEKWIRISKQFVRNLFKNVCSCEALYNFIKLYYCSYLVLLFDAELAFVL